MNSTRLPILGLVALVAVTAGGCDSLQRAPEAEGMMTSFSEPSYEKITLDLLDDGSSIPGGNGTTQDLYLIRVPKPGDEKKSYFGLLLPSPDGTAPSAQFTTAGGGTVDVGQGVIFLGSYGFEPRAQGPRGVGAGVGTKMILWVGPTWDRFFIVNPSGNDKVRVTPKGASSPVLDLSDKERFVEVDASGAIAVHNIVGNPDEAEIKAVLAYVETIAKGLNLPW